MYYGKRRMVQRAPLALLTISGLLDKEDYRVSVVSNALYDHSEEKIIRDCKNAICFGVTALTGYQITDGLAISKMIKNEYPKLPIVWGGWHPSLEPEGTLNSPYVDVVVRGQGEGAFYDLVKALEGRRDLSGLAGVSFKKNGNIIHNPHRELEDLNKFPAIPYHLIDVEKVLSNDEYGDRVLNYISSYGCPNNCSFCTERLVHKGKWTGIAASRMLDDFNRLHRNYGVDCIAVNDTQFFLNKKRTIEFCQGLIDRSIPVKWDNVEGNIRQLLTWTDDLWDLMVRSGLSSLLVGAESGYSDALKLMNKPLFVDETLRFAQKAKKFNIKVLYSLMLGLPWDSDYKKTQELISKEISMSLELSDKITSLNDKNRVLLCIYTPYPGNPLYEKSLEVGLKPPARLEDWGNWNLMKQTTPWISKKQAWLINFISSYIFFFLDSTSYDWVTARVKNKLIRFLFQRIFRLFIHIARFRWKHRFFIFPVDYWIYLLGREILKIA